MTGRHAGHGPSADGTDGFDWRAAERDLSTTASNSVLAGVVGDGAVADVLRGIATGATRGGVLLYGPPGCGKTFLARALAADLGPRFVTLNGLDVMDPFVGGSERNVHSVFEAARSLAPSVVFIDDLDQLGVRRTATAGTPLGAVTNQLLAELDELRRTTANVVVLAASNRPWDIDAAFRRPGRIDRIVPVMPPDRSARAAIFRYHLATHQGIDVDVRRPVRRTAGYAAGDLAAVCSVAAVLAGESSDGSQNPIAAGHLVHAARSVRSSIGPWMEIARNVVTFGGDQDAYPELRRYLKRSRQL